MSQQGFEATVSDLGQLVFAEPSRFRAWCLARKGKRVVVTIESEKRQRTLAQNSRYWVAYIPFAQEIFEQQTGFPFTKEMAHDALCKFFIGVSGEISVGGETITIRKRSSELDTIDFSLLTDRVEQWIQSEYKVNPKSIDHEANL